MDDRQGADTAAILRGAETTDLQEEGSHGVLLLHGFGDTPQTPAPSRSTAQENGIQRARSTAAGAWAEHGGFREIASERMDCSGEGCVHVDMRTR